MIRCPHCQKEIQVSAKVKLPKEQILTLELSREEGFFCAETLSGVIENTSKALKATAKSIGGKVEVFVVGVKLTDKKASIRLLVADLDINLPNE